VSIHERRKRIHEPRHIGDAVADKVTEALGSWRFIIAQSLVLALWIILNSVSLATHWDPAPFILLNLCLSFQAAFTGPVVLLSQNRQSVKDHLRDDLEATEVSQLVQAQEDLKQINLQQLTILQQQSEILTLLRGGTK